MKLYTKLTNITLHYIHISASDTAVPVSKYYHEQNQACFSISYWAVIYAPIRVFVHVINITAGVSTSNKV